MAMGLSVSWPVLLACWAVVELVFYLYRWRCYIHHDRRRTSAPFPDREDFMRRFVALAPEIDLRDFLSIWFHGAPASSIHRGNVADLVAYGFYQSELASLPAADRARIERFIDELEAAHDLHLPPGRTPGLKFMSHKWDKLRTLHIPAACFALSEVAALGADGAYWLMGFRRRTAGCLTYWTRPASHPPKSGTPPEPGVVFVHGLGLGLVPYVPFVAQMVRHRGRDRAIALVELRHIALRARSPIPEMEAIAAALAEVAGRHGAMDGRPPLFVAHSYGTALVARMQKLHPGNVGSAVLIDPVCFLVLRPELLRNFIYRAPGAGLTGAAAVHDAVRTTLCARELQSAAALCRHFDWYALMLWPDQLPPACLVALAACDELIDAGAARRHLEAAGVDVLWHPSQQHAGFLVDLKWQADILRRALTLGSS